MAKPKTHGLKAARLRAILHYDQHTGAWTWIGRSGRCSHIHIGDEAGHVDKRGYRRICIDGHLHRAHRLAHLYVHGRWPRDQMDHRRGVEAGDRLVNLRPATAAKNAQNRKCVGASGFKGVHFRRGRYHAYIGARGATQLGSFDVAEDAARAYDTAAVARYGEFARPNFPQTTEPKP